MCNTLIVNWPPSSFLFSLKTLFSSDDEEQKKFNKKGKVSSFIWEHFELDPNECWLSHCSLLWLWDFLLNDQSLYPRFCFVFFLTNWMEKRRWDTCREILFFPFADEWTLDIGPSYSFFLSPLYWYVTNNRQTRNWTFGWTPSRI
jgi:hypothetical protein